MALSYVGSGAVAVGGGGNVTTNPALPAGWAATDLAVLVVASAQEDGAVPTVTPVGGPWTYAGTTRSSTAAAYAEDAGARRLTFFTRILATGDGAPVVSLPQTLWASAAAHVIVLRKAATEAWTVITPTFGEDVDGGTAFAAAMAGTPTRMTTGAFLVAGYALTNSTTALSAETITATGATIGTVTERADAASTLGANVRLGTATATVTAGTATAAPTLGATLTVGTPGAAGLLVVLATTGTLTAIPATRGDALRYNGFTNPGAESGSVNGWGLLSSVGAPAYDVVDVFEEGLGETPTAVGRRAFRVTGAATNTANLGLYQILDTDYPVGDTVTVSFDCYIPAGSAADTIRIGWNNGATTTATSSVPAVTGWSRYYATWTVVTATLDRVQVYTVDTGAARGADTVYFDNLMVDRSPVLRDYLDGNTNSPGYVNTWTGTPEFSESAQYLAADPPRVGVTLTNWANDVPTQVYRVHHATGERLPVRGGALTPSGGAGFVWDYEFPTNEEIYYVADDSGTERTTALLDEVLVRVNANRNPALTVSTADWSQYPGPYSAATLTRVTAGGPVIGGVVRDFLRWTWQVAGATNTGFGVFMGSGAAQAIRATPGPFSASLYWRASDLTRRVRVGVEFYDSAGVQLTVASGATTPVGDASRWTRASLSTTAPARTDRAVVTLYIQNSGATLAAGETMDVTCLLTEDNVATVGTYFDGDTPGTGYRWAGTAGLSFSEAFATDVLTPLEVADTRSFLRAPGLPGLDMAVRIGRVPERTHARPVTFLAPVGRRTLVPQAGARQAPAYTLDLVTYTEAEAEALVALLEGAATMLLLFPGTDHHGTYVTLGDLAKRPNPKVGPGEAQWSVPATEVSQPAGGMAYDPSSSWAGLLATSSTWQAVLNTYPTWLDVLRGAPEA